MTKLRAALSFLCTLQMSDLLGNLFCRSEILIFRHPKHEILETQEMKHYQRFNLANIKPRGKKVHLQITMVTSF